MKIFSLAFLILLSFVVFISSCKKEEGLDTPDASIKIDSLRQDTIIFGTELIPGNLHIFYSVENNDFDDIHSFIFTINALNVDSTSYSVVEKNFKGVPGKSNLEVETVMGIGKSGYLDVKIEDIKFE